MNISRLVRAMLGERRGSAVTVLALTAVATAGAVAGPLYQEAATTATTTANLADAGPGGQAISRTILVSREGRRSREAPEMRPQLPVRDGFDTVGGLQLAGRLGRTTDLLRPGADSRAGTNAYLAYRADVCRHVTIVKGRCSAGAGEVIIAVTTAARLSVFPGGEVAFQSGRLSANGFDSEGTPTRLTVTGLYELGDLAGAYGAGRPFSGAAGISDDEDGTAAFATLETVAGTPFVNAAQTVDLIPRPSAYADLDALQQAVIEEQALADENQYAMTTGLDVLATRIAADRRVLDRSVQVAVVPLVLLALAVLYLAVASGAQRRRTEFGLAGLRGVPQGTRWWLAAAEYAVPAFVGVPLGIAIGYVSIGLLARLTLPGTPTVTLTLSCLAYAAVALGAAALAGALALRRAAAGPVAGLLRRTPARHRSALFGIGELIAVVLAGVAAYQITADPQPNGIALLTPVLVAIAIGLIVRRLAALVAGGAGRIGLRRGRIGFTLFALTLARRPGPARLLGLLMVLFAVVGFALAAAEAGSQARADRARSELGAAQVVRVRPVDPATLYNAVHRTDPQGTFAMAVFRLRDAQFPVLAVDAARLPAAAYWHAGIGVSVTTATSMLTTSTPDGRVPILSTAHPGGRIQATNDAVAVERVGTPPLIPRLGTTGGMIDMTSIVRSADPATPARDPEVWLGATAPAGTVDSLRANGLDIIGVQSAADRVAQAADGGPALALRFYVVASLAAVLLGVGGLLVLAHAEHDDQVRALRALRVQGLPTGSAWRQTLGGYAVLVATAAVIGTASAGLSWWVAHGVVPVFSDSAPYSLPSPDAIPLVLAVAAQAAVLLATAAATAATLHRAVERRAA